MYYHTPILRPYNYTKFGSYSVGESKLTQLYFLEKDFFKSYYSSTRRFAGGKNVALNYISYIFPIPLVDVTLRIANY